ncbi:MAG: hypothetical protein Q9175_005495 [Cornicularia normoerica]
MNGVHVEGFDNRQVQLIAVTSTCLALSTVTIILRLLVRWSSAAMFWWDDCVAVLALTVYVQQITWVLSTGLIILAILLFYTRIFPNNWMHKAVYIIGAWDAVWTLSTILVIIFQCTPIDFLWNRKIQGGRCINSDAFYFAACVASIVRLVVLFDIDLEDLMCKLALQHLPMKNRCLSNSLVLDTSASPQLWSCVEVSFGIISACLPSLTPLFLILLGKRPARSKNYSSTFRRHRDGNSKHAEFNRMADATDGVACSQSVELIIRNRDASDDLYNLHESGEPILVTHEVDQVRDRKTNGVPEADQVGVAADASTWNI